LSFKILTDLNLLFNCLAIFLFLDDINIFEFLSFDLKIPVMTDEVIFPVPINPKFIDYKYYNNNKHSIIKKTPLNLISGVFF